MDAELRVTPGTLLAAWPDLADPNFRHSVILMCHHNADGAYGLVVNRASTVTTRQLLPTHPDLGRVAFPVHVGGPVDKRALQFLHTAADEIPGGLSLDGKLWLGGELDALGRFVAKDPDAARAKVRLFIGYSGWGEGQLERELAARSWIPAPLSLKAVFGPPGEQAWRNAVHSIGDEGRDLLGQMPDPHLN